MRFFSGPLSLGALAAKIGVEPNTLSPVVKKLAGFGLVDRVRDPEDERRVILDILPYGHKVLDEATRATEAGWNALGVDPDKVRVAIDLLEDVKRKLDKAHPPKMTLPGPDDT